MCQQAEGRESCHQNIKTISCMLLLYLTRANKLVLVMVTTDHFQSINGSCPFFALVHLYYTCLYSTLQLSWRVHHSDHILLYGTHLVITRSNGITPYPLNSTITGTEITDLQLQCVCSSHQLMQVMIWDYRVVSLQSKILTNHYF